VIQKNRFHTFLVTIDPGQTWIHAYSEALGPTFSPRVITLIRIRYLHPCLPSTVDLTTKLNSVFYV